MKTVKILASIAIVGAALTSCGEAPPSSSDSEPAAAAQRGSATKQAACDEWDAFQQTEAAYEEAFSINGMAPEDERQAATNDLGAGTKDLKAAFAKAAGADPSWNDAQLAAYEYVKGSMLGENHSPSEKTEVDAACDRVG